MSAFNVASDVRNKRMQMKRAVRNLKKLGIPLPQSEIRETYQSLKQEEAKEIADSLRRQLEESGNPAALIYEIRTNQRFFKYESSFEDQMLGLH